LKARKSRGQRSGCHANPYTIILEDVGSSKEGKGNMRGKKARGYIKQIDNAERDHYLKLEKLESD